MSDIGFFEALRAHYCPGLTAADNDELAKFASDLQTAKCTSADEVNRVLAEGILNVSRGEDIDRVLRIAQWIQEN